jgi:hypothetical protein
MKKKYRDIVVNDKKYAWRFLQDSDPYEGGGGIRIWKDKKIVYNKWHNENIEVTPKMVANIIEGEGL